MTHPRTAGHYLHPGHFSMKIPGQLSAEINTASDDRQFEQLSDVMSALLLARRIFAEGAELLEACVLAGADRVVVGKMFGPNWIPDRLDVTVTTEANVRRATVHVPKIEKSLRRSTALDAIADIDEIDEASPAEITHDLISSAGSWQVEHMTETTRPSSIRKLPESNWSPQLSQGRSIAFSLSLAAIIAADYTTARWSHLSMILFQRSWMSIHAGNEIAVTRSRGQT